MKRKEKQQMSCYFTSQERRAIQEAADRLERSDSQIVQFGVRVFSQLLKTDPDQALRLSQIGPATQEP